MRGRLLGLGLGLGLIACAPAAAPPAPRSPAQQAAATPTGATPPARADRAAPATGAAAAAGPSRAERRAQHAQAMAAYTRKDYAACGPAFERADDRYGAACCRALAGEADAAFALLARAIDDGLQQDLAGDDDFAALHGDPRWQATLDRQAARTAAHDRTLNAELVAIYHEDQGDRAVSSYEQIDWDKIRPRDQARRKRVDEIIAAGGARAADDYYHAAMVYQHGETVDEIQRAHDLAMRAVALDPNHKQARWLAAAAEDRTLSYAYKAQKWGTQFKKVDGKWIVWPVDPAITDDERDAWNVPSLAEAEARVAGMNAKLNATKDAAKQPEKDVKDAKAAANGPKHTRPAANNVKATKPAAKDPAKVGAGDAK